MDFGDKKEVVGMVLTKLGDIAYKSEQKREYELKVKQLELEIINIKQDVIDTITDLMK